MSGPEERCKRCDRLGCDRRDAGIALHRASKGKRIAVGAYVSDEYQAALARVIKADETCRAIDWRASALASRAAIREALAELHHAINAIDHDTADKRIQEAMATLRAALKEPDRPDQRGMAAAEEAADIAETRL